MLPDSSIFVISSKLQQSMQKYRRRGVCRGRVSDLWRLLYPKVATARVLHYVICRGGKASAAVATAAIMYHIHTVRQGQRQ